LSLEYIGKFPLYEVEGVARRAGVDEAKIYAVDLATTADVSVMFGSNMVVIHAAGLAQLNSRVSVIS